MEKIVDRDSRQKLYVQIYSIIKEKIEKGIWTAGTQIPTEDELCKTYDVSKATVREAMSELVREGYLSRRQGKGTFVTYSVPHQGLPMRTKIGKEEYGGGVIGKREVLLREVREVPEDVKTYLGDKGDLYYILCKNVVDGELAFVEEFFVPLLVLPVIEEDITKISFYDYIEEKGTRKIFRIVQTAGIARVRKDLAFMLGVKEGSLALLIKRVLVGSDGSPIAYTRIIGSGSKYEFQMEFERIK